MDDDRKMTAIKTSISSWIRENPFWFWGISLILLAAWPLVTVFVFIGLLAWFAMILYQRPPTSSFGTESASSTLIKGCDQEEAVTNKGNVSEESGAGTGRTPSKDLNGLKTTRSATKIPEAANILKEDVDVSQISKDEMQNTNSSNLGEVKKPLAAVGGAAILARLKAEKAARSAAPKSNPLIVLYASQLGTAAEIAKTINSEANVKGIKSIVSSMNEYGFENLSAEKSPVVILVASSTGDGDPPDNCAKFYAGIRKKSNTSDILKGIKFTCLGLGDSNYTRFMHIPRVLKSKFQEHGAEIFYKCAEADEVDGLEEVVDSWIEGLWPAIKNTIDNAVDIGSVGQEKNNRNNDRKSLTLPPLPPTTIEITWLKETNKDNTSITSTANVTSASNGGKDIHDAENPFLSRIINAKYLTTSSSKDRTVIHLELDIEGSGFDYHPGDSIGILPENSPFIVDEIISHLGVDGNQPFAVRYATDEKDVGNRSRPLGHLGWPCTVREAFSRGCDLTSIPKKSMLRMLAEHASNPSEQEKLLWLCSREGKDAYKSEIMEKRPNFLDILKAFASCKPPLGTLLEGLPPLPPRMYSVSCSPLEYQKSVHVAFSVVDYETAYGKKEGVATSWLHRVLRPWLADNAEAGTPLGHENICIPIFWRRGGDFKVPESLEKPWIMIGPGTGVAPFRGFLQERRFRIQNRKDEVLDSNFEVAPALLYFGCRHPDQDFLYQKELEEFDRDGTLTDLHVAFSRLNKEKTYVQHLMANHSSNLYELIVKKNGYVFVCGDGFSMAKDVHSTLLQILKEHGMDHEEATHMLADMMKQGRYVRDIWS